VTPDFLDVADVLTIHRLQVDRFGGTEGLRDQGLLSSAVSQPQLTFDGEFVHNDLVEMAAAYLFHLVSNHPFVDGNKRVGLATALVFLDMNGLPLRHGTDDLYELTMAVAEGSADKSEVTATLRTLLKTE
jgi:death-on-curing protein